MVRLSEGELRDCNSAGDCTTLQLCLSRNKECLLLDIYLLWLALTRSLHSECSDGFYPPDVVITCDTSYAGWFPQSETSFLVL